MTQHAVENALRLYRELFEGLPIGLYRTAPDGRILDANPALARMLGYDEPGELTGLDTASFYVDDGERGRWRARLEQAGVVSGFEARLRRRDGRIIQVEDTARLVHDEAGAIVWFEGTLQDVTDARRAQTLRVGQARLLEMIAVGMPLADTLDGLVRLIERLCDGMLGSILLLDETGKRLRHGAAPSLPEAYARAVDGIAIGPNVGSCGTAMYLGRSVIVADIATDPLWADYRELAGAHGLRACWSTPIAVQQGRIVGSFAMYYREPRSPSEAETELIATAAHIAGIAIESAQATGALHRMYAAAQRELQERERIEAQLLQAQKMEAIGRLAGGVAHDFNNTLGVILGYGRLLVARLEGDLKRRMEQIVEAGERAADLTRQLLAFSRKQVLHARVVDLNDVVGGMDDMLRRLIGEDVQLTSTLGATQGFVRADPGQIGQVLMNLAVNARDAMPSGGRLTIETTNVVLDEAYAAQHPGSHAGPHVMLAVSDSGVGMSPDVQRHVFEPFFTTKEKGKGTGLGLATAYGVVKQSDGYIEVESRLGAGTTFRVYLPAVREEPAETGAREPEPSPRGSETILIVEDDPAVLGMTREMLQNQGYRVIPAPSGPAALDAAERHDGAIDLLLTDVVMPGMGGRELAERLTATRPRLRLMFMSGYTDDAVIRHGVEQRSTAFIQKPFRPEALAHKVREVLDRTPRGEEIPG